ncbi:MAG: ankyrin repeat domain-containing protein [Pyrinomonadaceae bacterium]|nr:ankyrin repeat domain-containing protein [Pyrinomonadaceae bacterium]
MKLIFSFNLCALLISGSFVASVSTQSELTAQGASSLAKDGKTSAMPGESECVRKAELRRRFLADTATRVVRPALMHASSLGRIQTVRALLKRGVPVNKKDAIGVTALMLAAEAGHVEVIKALLVAGADPNAAGGIAHGPIFSVMTMAMNSSNKNRMEVIDTLIAGGARMNPAGGSPVAPLVYAIEGCDVVMITALLKRGADVNWNGGEPLVAAVTNAYPEVEIVKVLLAAGADPNLPRVSVGGDEITLVSMLEQKMKLSRDDGGKTRDDYQEEIVRLLKKAGAKTLK